MRRDITLESECVSKPVTVSIFSPEEKAHADERLPLMLLLHGGDGGKNFVKTAEAILKRAWTKSALPPLMAVTPHVGRSFYMDYRDGSARWESFVMGPLLDHVRGTFPVRDSRAHTVIAGISMGGMGGLRLAFKHPDVFAGVAALEPGVEPVAAYADLTLRDTFYRAPQQMEKVFGAPVDEEYWAANHPPNIAARNSARLRDSGLGIYIECGDEDAFNLHHGAEYLHRVLWDNGIKHEYRSVRGADHMGLSLVPRFLDAFRFLSKVLNPPPPDPTLAPFRKMIQGMKATAGLTE